MAKSKHSTDALEQYLERLYEHRSNPNSGPYLHWFDLLLQQADKLSDRVWVEVKEDHLIKQHQSYTNYGLTIPTMMHKSWRATLHIETDQIGGVEVQMELPPPPPSLPSNFSFMLNDARFHRFYGWHGGPMSAGGYLMGVDMSKDAMQELMSQQPLVLKTAKIKPVKFDPYGGTFAASTTASTTDFKAPTKEDLDHTLDALIKLKKTHKAEADFWGRPKPTTYHNHPEGQWFLRWLVVQPRRNYGDVRSDTYTAIDPEDIEKRPEPNYDAEGYQYVQRGKSGDYSGTTIQESGITYYGQVITRGDYETAPLAVKKIFDGDREVSEVVRTHTYHFYALTEHDTVDPVEFGPRGTGIAAFLNHDDGEENEGLDEFGLGEDSSEDE